MPENKYETLLLDPDVSRWYQNVSRGAQSTADVSIRGLGRFCEIMSTSPGELAKTSENQVVNLMLDYVTKLEHNGKAGSYIESCLKPIKSWMLFNGKGITRKIKIRNTRATTTLRGERVPTQDELKKIFLSATKATRISCALMAHSGLRPEVIGDYLGKDGIRVGDILDMEISGEEITFKELPARIVVREELSKSRKQYFTFIGEESADYLADYLKYRIRSGEKVNSDTPLIVPRNGRPHFIRTINIGDQVRKAIRKAGFPWRPYVLRSYFDTQLMMAESKGYILRDYRQFFMGHVGDIEHTYTVNRHTLPDSVIEDMRSSYSRSLRYLETIPKGPTEEEASKKFKAQILHMDGFTDEEIEKMGLLEMDEEELRIKRRDKLFGAALNGNKQKVVNLDTVENYIEGGWEYVGSLPGDKAIIKPPS